MQPRKPMIVIVRPEGFWSSWLGATGRITDVAEILDNNGWHVTLLAARKPSSDADRNQEASFPGTVLRTPFSGGYPKFIDFSNATRRVWRLGWRFGGEALFARRMELGWASRIIAWASGENAFPRPDIVWAISTGRLAGMAAGRRLSRQYSCPLILEIHDPVKLVEAKGKVPFLLEELEQCIEESAAIITTTASLAQQLKLAYPRSAGKIEVLYLSFKTRTPPPATAQKRDSLTLLHTGALAGGKGRNARAIVMALQILFSTAPDSREKVKLRLLGGGKGACEAKALATKLGLANAVEVLPPCSPELAQKEMDRADILVVIKYDQAEYDMQIPGKLFQYLGKGKPILGIMRATEAAEILARSGLGVVVRDDATEVAERLHEFWRNRNDLHENYRPDETFVRHFSFSEIGARLLEILGCVRDPTRAAELRNRACHEAVQS